MSGVVAAGHQLTAQAGADVLRAGGNAVDAAVAAVLMSWVCEPLLTGPGAGGFMLVHTPAGENALLDFFVAAPGKGSDQESGELTAFEVAEFVGCHEETVRRAYLRGLLASQRFGVRGRRFHPADVLDWIRRGAPTRVS